MYVYSNSDKTGSNAFILSSPKPWHCEWCAWEECRGKIYLNLMDVYFSRNPNIVLSAFELRVWYGVFVRYALSIHVFVGSGGPHISCAVSPSLSIFRSLKYDIYWLVYCIMFATLHIHFVAVWLHLHSRYMFVVFFISKSALSLLISLTFELREFENSLLWFLTTRSQKRNFQLTFNVCGFWDVSRKTLADISNSTSRTFALECNFANKCFWWPLANA